MSKWISCYRLFLLQWWMSKILLTRVLELTTTCWKKPVWSSWPRRLPAPAVVGSELQEPWSWIEDRSGPGLLDSTLQLTVSSLWEQKVSNIIHCSNSFWKLGGSKQKILGPGQRRVIHALKAFRWFALNENQLHNIGDKEHSSIPSNTLSHQFNSMMDFLRG